MKQCNSTVNILVLLSILVCITSACLYRKEDVTTTHWHYGQGSSGVTPYYWWKVNENCSHGSLEDTQSPIDITDSKYHNSMKAIKLSYPDALAGSASNNGHTINFVATDGSDYILSNGPLGNDEYSFLSFHMHWGESEAGHESLGSEHSIEGHKQAAEIHFVHANTKYNTTDITNHSDGIAVIGVLLEVSSNGDSDYDQLFEIASQLPLPESEAVAFQVDIESLLPNSLDYYHYGGSLTAPGCNSAVKWIVLRDSIKITPEQLDVLFRLNFQEEEESGEIISWPIGPNNRPIQPVNDRAVYRSFQVDEDNVESSSATLLLCSLVVIAFSFLSCL